MDDEPTFEDHYLPWAKRLVGPMGPDELLPYVTTDSSHPLEIFGLAKQMDGMPTANGTFPLAGARAATFLSQRDRRPLFYEPLANPGQVLDVLVLGDSLRRGGAPEWALPHVQVAFSAFRSIFDAPEGRVPLPHPGDAKVGDHEVLLTGEWNDFGRWLRFENWWGPEWGDHGYGHLSLEYLDRYLYEAWLSRDASIGPTVWTYPAFVGAAGERERAADEVGPPGRD